MPDRSYRASRRRARIETGAFVGVYILLSILVYGSSWLHGISHTLQCGGCGDNGQEVWFLAWASHAFTNLQDPLRTNIVNYPFGADLANLTSMPLAGILSTPVIALSGPIAAYNVLLVGAFAGSATAAMFASRRFVKSTWAAFLAGLIYGFSPYMIGQGAGHLFALFAAIPPLMLIVLDEMLVVQERHWWASGVALGLLAVFQLGFSLEVFADVVVVGLIGVLILVMASTSVRTNFRRSARSLGLAAIIAAPVAALFLYIGRTGPEHASGPLHPVQALSGLSSDIASLFAPTVNQFVNFGTSSYGSKLVLLTPPGRPWSNDVTENGAYIGIPLLLLLLFGLYKYRKEAFLRFSFAVAGAAFLISMGAHLHLFGHSTPVPLPFDIFIHLPLLDSEVASRYTLFMWLFLAMAVAFIVDHWWRDAGRPVSRKHVSKNRIGPVVARRAVPIGLLGLGLLALFPDLQYSIHEAFVPPWFASSAVSHVPEGSTLMTYPLARNTHNFPMMWQALNGMGYRIPAGEVAVPYSPGGPVEKAFDTCWMDPTEKTPPSQLVDQSRTWIRTWEVATVVVPEVYTVNPGCAVNFLSAVLEKAPSWQDGAAVWSINPPG